VVQPRRAAAEYGWSSEPHECIASHRCMMCFQALSALPNEVASIMAAQLLPRAVVAGRRGAANTLMRRLKVIPHDGADRTEEVQPDVELSEIILEPSNYIMRRDRPSKPDQVAARFAASAVAFDISNVLVWLAARSKGAVRLRAAVVRGMSLAPQESSKAGGFWGPPDVVGSLQRCLYPRTFRLISGSETKLQVEGVPQVGNVLANEDVVTFTNDGLQCWQKKAALFCPDIAHDDFNFPASQRQENEWM